MNNSLLNLFFPNICSGCSNSLFVNEYLLCTKCLANLPETNFHLEKGNTIEKIFWGRVQVENAFSFLYFKKDGMAQRLLHHLKYRGVKEMGVLMGKLYALRIRDICIQSGVNAIAAVPLHKSKLLKRGYNQAQLFADGLAPTLSLDDLGRHITRIRATETQTHKTRIERQENVEQIFRVTAPEIFAGRHVLVVDDVITTGATLESCITALAAIQNCKVSVASIAYAG